MCNLCDCMIHETGTVREARQAGLNDAQAGRKAKIPFCGIPEADIAYRNAYAMTAFHDTKAKLLANAIHL